MLSLRWVRVRGEGGSLTAQSRQMSLVILIIQTVANFDRSPVSR